MRHGVGEVSAVLLLQLDTGHLFLVLVHICGALLELDVEVRGGVILVVVLFLVLLGNIANALIGALAPVQLHVHAVVAVAVVVAGALLAQELEDILEAEAVRHQELLPDAGVVQIRGYGQDHSLLAAEAVETAALRRQAEPLDPVAGLLVGQPPPALAEEEVEPVEPGRPAAVKVLVQHPERVLKVPRQAAQLGQPLSHFEAHEQEQQLLLPVLPVDVLHLAQVGEGAPVRLPGVAQVVFQGHPARGVVLGSKVGVELREAGPHCGHLGVPAVGHGEGGVVGCCAEVELVPGSHEKVPRNGCLCGRVRADSLAESARSALFWLRWAESWRTRPKEEKERLLWDICYDSKFRS